MKRWLKPIFQSSMRTVFRMLPKDPNTRDIVLACQNPLMAEHLRNVWELIRDDRRLNFYVTFDAEEAPGDHEKIKQRLPVKAISSRWSKVRNWDLVILADHGFFELAVPERHPVLRIAHGGTGKVLRGQTVSYSYNVNSMDGRGRPRYTRIFESSEANRERTIEMLPQFEGRIAVVGNLMHDKVLKMAESRDQYRRELGYRPDDIVVAVMSTWGPESLFESMGDEILDEIKKIKGRFKFILTTHPYEYKPQGAGERIWGEYLRTKAEDGIFVREPEDEWTPYMVASDVMLTDHTSLMHSGILLKKPALFVPTPEEVLLKNSPPWKMREISPVLTDVSCLAESLMDTIENFPYDKLDEICNEINSYPGECASRMREEIYDLLKIRQP